MHEQYVTDGQQPHLESAADAIRPSNGSQQNYPTIPFSSYSGKAQLDNSRNPLETKWDLSANNSYCAPNAKLYSVPTYKLPDLPFVTANYVYKPLPLTCFDSGSSLRQPRLQFSSRPQRKSGSVNKRKQKSEFQTTGAKYLRKQTLPLPKCEFGDANERQEGCSAEFNSNDMHHSNSESMLTSYQNSSPNFGESKINSGSGIPSLQLGNYSYGPIQTQGYPGSPESRPLNFEGCNSNRSNASSKRSAKILFTKSNSVKLFKKKRGPSSHSSESCIEEPSTVNHVTKRSSFFKQLEPKLSDFRKGKLLGKGNFGQVYVAEHIETGFLCAMKVIPKQKIKEDKIEQQMTRELKLHSILKHRNIVEQYGFFFDEEYLYIMVELCPDGQLYNVIKRKKRFTEATAAFLIRQLCEGLLYLHDSHIIHRDIKPENIILTNGIIKICDFGWAVNCATGMRGTRCGTPLYLSPEMIKGEQYDDSVDIWAVGVLTYELLVGSMPFKIWWEGQLNKIVSEQVKFPSYVELSSTSKDFILKILEKNPTNRIDVEGLLHHPFLRDARESPEYFVQLA